MPEETAQSGLSENAACGLAYITIIPAIIFLVVAPYNTNRNVKFHAWQSIFLGIAGFALGIIGIAVVLEDSWVNEYFCRAFLCCSRRNITARERVLIGIGVWLAAFRIVFQALLMYHENS